MTPTLAPPRDDLYRAVLPGIELRSAERAEGDAGADAPPTMVGHFAVFNRWTEIDSFWEGRFLERVAPGAFKKTMREQRDSMRVLFQHGHDPQIADKPLGPIEVLREDDTGAYYEVPLLDARYVREDVQPGLAAGLYGSSFRFRVMREEFVEQPEPSDENPAGLPERTLKEVKVMEFGPVTFPAYAEATAGMRSLTDDMIWRRLADEPERAARFFAGDHDRAAALADMIRSAAIVTAPPAGAAEPPAVAEREDPAGEAPPEGATDATPADDGERVEPPTPSADAEAPAEPPASHPEGDEPPAPAREDGTSTTSTAAAPGIAPTPTAGTLPTGRSRPSWALPSTDDAPSWALPTPPRKDA